MQKLTEKMFKAIQDSRELVRQDRYSNHEYGDIDEAEAADNCACVAKDVLKEFGDWWNAGNKEPQDTVISEGAVSDFLTSKYGKG